MGRIYRFWACGTRHPTKAPEIELGHLDWWKSPRYRRRAFQVPPDDRLAHWSLDQHPEKSLETRWDKSAVGWENSPWKPGAKKKAIFHVKISLPSGKLVAEENLTCQSVPVELTMPTGRD